MNDIITDLLAIIGVVLNGLPQGLLALAYGFASVPTALAFFVGAIGNTVTQSVAPISFQAETITYAGTAGKNRSERCTMIFIGGAVMALIGAFGLLTKIVDFIGEDVAYGMMAGVGSILTKAAIDMIKSDKISGGVSLAAALITYFITRNNAPHAVWAGVAMMVIIGVILLTKLLPKIGKYVPASSIAGFLFVLGIFKTVVLDAPVAFDMKAAVGGTTMVVTAVTNPFLGTLTELMQKK